jgi:hypothetical protein
MIKNIIATITIFSVTILPIKIIWRWPILGIIPATILSQAICTLSDFLTSLLQDQVDLEYHFNAEYWEYWWFSLFLTICYCLLISFCKGIYLLMKKFLKN